MVNGVSTTGPDDGGEFAASTCSPATELYYTNVVNYTAMVSGRSATYSLQQCGMEDHKKPNVLEEFVGNIEEKFQSLSPEMEDAKESYLDIRNPSSRQPRGDAHNTKQTKPNRP